MWSIRFLYWLKFPWLVLVLCLFIQEHLTVDVMVDVQRTWRAAPAQADPAWCHWSCSLSVLLLLVPGVFEKLFLSQSSTRSTEHLWGFPLLSSHEFCCSGALQVLLAFQICSFNCWGRIFWKHVAQCQLCPPVFRAGGMLLTLLFFLCPATARNYGLQ